MTATTSPLDLRRVGEYGHFVAPFVQLMADAEAFLGVDLSPYRSEVIGIHRDEQGVHPEEAGVLYLLVRGLRPGLTLETGTFKGYSTSEIARALQANQRGHLLTVDVAASSGTAVPQHLLPYVTFSRGEPSQAFAQRLPRDQRLNLFFHDSLHTFMNTLGELIWFADHLEPGAVIVCHDAKMDYLDDFGVGKAVRKFAGQLKLEYRILDTTCGLALLKWPARVPPAALATLREEYGLMQRRAYESRFKRILRKLART